ncbi:Vamp1 [Symbiodinium sp. CCMP2456]|nr:Vamp1 [Symbiodinium sp. CCMP2456]
MAVMQDNMRAMAERDSQLNQLEARTNDLQGASKAFSSGAKRLQRHYQWQRYKFYFAIGAVVVLVVALILLPSQYKVPRTRMLCVCVCVVCVSCSHACVACLLRRGVCDDLVLSCSTRCQRKVSSRR